MYRVVFSVIVAVVMAHPEGMPKCGRIAHGGMECCKKDLLPLTGSTSAEVKECFQLAKKPPSCDVDICIAKKLGFASDDGTIDKHKMTADLETRFEKDPELVDSIKENCINGDLSKYGPPDFCELMKHKMCVEVQVIKSCEDWSDEGNCSGMKDLAEECVKQFS